MSEQPWSDLAQRWSDLLLAQAATAQEEWFNGQSQLVAVASESVAEQEDPLLSPFAGIRELLRPHGPRLADVGRPEPAGARTMELSLAVQESAQAYKAVVGAAWAEANTRFTEEVSHRDRASDNAPTATDTLRHWLDIVDQVLLETHRSPIFLDAQRQLLCDCMNFMLNQRELLESVAEPTGLPTRSEIDEIHRSVHELKRRVKALEKQSKTSNRHIA